MRTIIIKIFLSTIILLLQISYVIASGLETKGMGGRARGMGFAMVSISNDWTSVHYNPASIGTENIFGAEYEFFTGSFDSSQSLRNLSILNANVMRGDFIDFIGDEPISFNKKKIESDIHFGAFGTIFNINRFSFGIGMYGSGSGTAWEDSIYSAIGDLVNAEVSFINGSLNIPLAIAYSLTTKLSIGYTFGLHYGLLTYENSKIRNGIIPYTSKNVQDTNGIGISSNFGILWKIKENLNLGFVFKLPYNIRRKGNTEIEQSLLQLHAKTDTTIDMNYPLRLVIG
ncbi:hypothetical protein BVX93_00850, partial [bacterium B13(2017)]